MKSSGGERIPWSSHSRSALGLRLVLVASFVLQDPIMDDETLEGYNVSES
jgi:hypothetical protein